MTESEKAARQYAGYGLETSEVLLALSNDTEDYRKYIAFKHGYETAQKQNTELKEALREAKVIILELEGARFMKTSFYDQINKLIYDERTS